ncbi:hypothetical protein chiPu_0027105, partial [Chiloscyllium punctatum]|nr:hypothetical protein [Chiloscyllium punctatum]
PVLTGKFLLGVSVQGHVVVVGFKKDWFTVWKKDSAI